MMQSTTAFRLGQVRLNVRNCKDMSSSRNRAVDGSGRWSTQRLDTKAFITMIDTTTQKISLHEERT